MIYTKIYSNASSNDVNQAIHYLKHSLKNPTAANKLYSLVESTAIKLQTFPYKHPMLEDQFLAMYEIRYIAVNNYLLFYTVTEETKTIYIVRFIYSRSNWKHILKHTIKYDEYLSSYTGSYVHEEIEEYGKQFKKEFNNMPDVQDVNMDKDNFDEEKARQELYDEIKKGLDDIAAGRTIPAEEVYAKLDKKFEGYDFK